MPIQTINTICCRQIGLVIGEKEDQDCWKQLKTEWENRYFNLDAFLVHVAQEDTAEQIARNVTEEIRKQGLIDIGNKPVIGSIFIGLQKEPDLEQLAAAESALKMLSDGLGFTLPLILHFGYLGEMCFADKKVLRENIKKVANREQPMINYTVLVAKAPLMDQSNQSHWKAVISFLDILRRCAAPAVETPNYNFGSWLGFLGYDQYDEKQVEELEEQSKRIERLQGDAGEAELREQYRDYLQKAEDQVRHDFKITAGMMPMHPDMNVSGRLNQYLARHNKNKVYMSARESTRNALAMTGKRLESSVETAYEELINRTTDVLRDLLDKAEAGILLQQNKRKLKEILNVEEQIPQKPTLPEMQYDEYVNDQCERTVTEYLERIMDHAIATEKQRLVEAFCMAAENIDPSIIKEKNDKLLQRKAAIENQLHVIMSKAMFKNMALNDTSRPSSAISAVKPGGELRKFTVTDDEGLSEELNAFGITPVYCVTPAPGVETKKMWHVSLFADKATDERLEDLI